MCSVIGVLSKKRGSAVETAVRLLDELRHRGPEAFGLKSEAHGLKSRYFGVLRNFPGSDCVLGHCLLSTTGYAEQPISLGDVSVSHNGQVYNYNEFACNGAVSSDSEAIAGFLQRELENKNLASALKVFSKKAIGEYALGILHKNGLFAFRDFVGQKPIWFGENSEVLAFASEPVALMKAGVQFPRSLEPGHLLEATKKGFKVTKIFGVQDFRKTLPKTASQASLQKEFAKTISMMTAGLEKAAVLFSGGVDSSLVAKAVSEKVPCTKLYVAGIEGSHDIIAAEESASLLGLELDKIVLSGKAVEGLALECASILGFFDAMQVAIAVPELACAERISRHGFKVVFSGQGSDEIFCGYSNYSSVLAARGYRGVEEQLWSSLSGMWSRNFYRDDIIFSRHSLELRIPFLQQNFLSQAMAIPPQQKILSLEDGLRKHPVRELAESYGAHASIVQKKKKALQYGSGVQKIVSRLFS